MKPKEKKPPSGEVSGFFFGVEGEIKTPHEVNISHIRVITLKHKDMRHMLIYSF